MLNLVFNLEDGANNTELAQKNSSQEKPRNISTWKEMYGFNKDKPGHWFNSIPLKLIFGEISDLYSKIKANKTKLGLHPNSLSSSFAAEELNLGIGMSDDSEVGCDEVDKSFGFSFEEENYMTSGFGKLNLDAGEDESAMPTENDDAHIQF